MFSSPHIPLMIRYDLLNFFPVPVDVLFEGDCGFVGRNLDFGNDLLECAASPVLFTIETSLAKLFVAMRKRCARKPSFTLNARFQPDTELAQRVLLIGGGAAILAHPFGSST